MNTRFLKLCTLIASSTLFATGCGDNSSFETPNTSGASKNSGVVSQKNISLLAEDPQPEIFDDTGAATDTTLVMTVKIGDRNNQLLTDEHTVYFATEWGLIEPSCVTKNGTCNVNWQTSFGPSTVPSDHQVTITAYTLGEEQFSDTNSNGELDDNDGPLPGSADLFIDRVEPFVDADRTDGPFNSLDTLIDVMNGNELGANGEHDEGDGFLNSENCTHSSMCSTTQLIYIWDDININMDGPPDTTTTTP